VSLILTLSVLIRLLTLAYAIVVGRKLQDWRFAFLGAVVGLMALRQTMTLFKKQTSWALEYHAALDEMPGLLVSILMLIALYFLSRMIIDLRHKSLALKASNDELVLENKRRAEAEKHNYHLAYFDALTGLPNRNFLISKLDELLDTHDKASPCGALILVSVDRFKKINDARGHATGDLLLQEISQRLGALLDEGDCTLFRLSASEFALFLKPRSSVRLLATSPLSSLANEISASLSRPFTLRGEELLITVSIGMTDFSGEGLECGNETLRRAEMALHDVKDQGGNFSAFFIPEMSESVAHKFQLESALKQALPNDELRLFLQPQVNFKGKTVGAEVLLRWEHPINGLTPPGIFIPLAEESGLIVDMGKWVLSESLRMMAESVMKGRILKLSVNISPHQFRQIDFVPWLIEELHKTRVDPTHLTLEVTEGLVIENIDEVITKMLKLAELGIHFSIDDFGTGYSSLAYLKRLPVDELKIDRSFIQDAPVDKGDAALVETIIAVAQGMGLKVVAEGVETEEQSSYLSTHPEVIMQGYLFGRPAPAHEWLARWEQG
jgi:diguanylate cyclase (GGDEF)-like protein